MKCMVHIFWYMESILSNVLIYLGTMKNSIFVLGHNSLNLQ